MDSYDDKFKEKLMRWAVVFGGLIHGLNAAAGTNVAARLVGGLATRVLFLALGVVTVFVASDRDFFLPFLGDAVFPNGLLAAHVTPNGADVMVSAAVPPNTKVVYWAAEPCYENCDVPVMAWDAYKTYTNSGVATSDEQGNVRFMVRGPQAYNVPYKDHTLRPHIHYRYLRHNGMFSRIFTTKV